MRQLIRLLIVLVLACAPLEHVAATPDTPQTPPRPPQPTAASAPAAQALGAPSVLTLDLPALKAVLLVGPIDGDTGPWTTQEKQNMELAAVELEANGVEVHRFYAPDNDWEQIKVAAEGAHFLLYRSHGVYWSPMPTPTVGGFSLEDRIYSSDDIRSNLHLAPNAIVMLYGCFTAGSSSLDGGAISSQEAQRRVAQYSDPFLDLGAAGYYANWFGDAFQMYVRFLFQGMTLGEAYHAYFDFNSATAETYLHPDHPELALWLDKDDWGYWQYNNAFAGQPDQTLVDLFAPSALAVTPDTITYVAEPVSPAQAFTFQVTIQGTGNLTWTASITPTDAAWVVVQPATGYGEQQVTAVITPTGKPLGTYEAHIQVTADPLQSGSGDEEVTVTLHVLERIQTVYLPLIRRGAP